MPPALSDDSESSGDDEIPAQKKGKQPAAQVDEEEQEEADEEDDGEPAEDEYIVEAILAHKWVKGELEFDVKWMGYDDPKDRTWEPESNMGGAVDVLKEYFKKLGGRPQPPKGQKRKGRQSGVNSEAGTPASSTKRAKQEKQWSPPPGSWEHDVSHIDTIEQTKNPKTGETEKFVYLVWKNQKKTQHPLKHVNLKCPQKMLLYYESHLVFTQNDDILDGGDQNGDNDGTNVVMKDSD